LALYHPLAECSRDRRRTRSHIELLEQVTGVGIDRVDADAEPVGNFLGGEE